MRTWELGQEERAAVSDLSGQGRYEYFLKRVCDWELVWSLWQDGWAAARDDAGNEVFSVWPHPDFALACAADEWGEMDAVEVSLEAWISEWLPRLKNEGVHLAVFPTPKQHGVVVPADQLLRDLQAMLDEWY